uniref:Ig-like domain-containing protein n=1 Tax=Poecilia mexicana TaxID=48701 RepID=A0A3B3YU13_9TELE
MQEEEVTFGAVYEYYNPPTDWGRPLTPESEMSIEIGSTMSEEIAEVPERFFTPGSSTEVSQPIAESLHTLKSPPSFHTPNSDRPSGFMTPDEFPFSPVHHKRPSTGDSTEKFFSPVHFLNSPADEGVKTDPNGVSLDESRFLSQGKGSLGPATLPEKVQGIPPAFLKPLIKKRVFENDSLTFYAEVFGLPSPDVRWFFNKTQLVADDRVKMDRDGDNITLVIHNVTKADQGEYICEAVNYVGEARSVALVVVVSQEVRFMPAPPAVTHQHVMEFDNKYSLHIKSLELTDQGVYLCKASNSVGTATFTTELTVITPLKDTEVKEGQEIVLNCEVNIEGAKAKWLKNDETLFESGKYVMVQRDNVFSLRIKDARKGDEADYSITLTNQRGEQAKSSGKLSVRGWRRPTSARSSKTRPSPSSTMPSSHAS